VRRTVLIDPEARMTTKREVKVSFDAQLPSLRLANCLLRTFSLKVARHERAFGSRERVEGESNGGVDGTRTRSSDFF
jgi:hypothetical protein